MTDVDRIIDIELDESYLEDGPVECDGCGQTFPASALMGSGLCGICEYGPYEDIADYDDDVLTERERQVTVDIPVILREFAREMDEEDIDREGATGMGSQAFRQREEAPLVKPTGPCVDEVMPDGTHWKV